MQYYPADALGDDETWERIKPFVAADFAERDGAMLAAQWQACLDYDSGTLLPRNRRCRSTPSPSPRTCRRRRNASARSRSSPRNGHFHLLQGLGHGSAFGHRPEVVNRCLREILDWECRGVALVG